MCVDMCTDMCVDMCADMCADICVFLYAVRRLESMGSVRTPSLPELLCWSWIRTMNAEASVI